MKRKLREALRRILSIVLMIVMLPLSSLQPAFTAIVHAEGTDDYVAESVISENDTDEDAIYSITPENPSEDVISNEDTVENNEDVADDQDVIVGEETSDEEDVIVEEETENNDEEDADIQNADEEADDEDGEVTSEEDADVIEEINEEDIVTQEEISNDVINPDVDVIIELGLKAELNECADSVLTWNKAELENAEYFIYRNDELITSFSIDEEGEENANVSEEEGLVSYIDSNTTADTEFSYKVVLKVGETIISESETKSVKTPQALVIEQGVYYSLSSDLTVFSVTMNRDAYLYLNGHELTICKDFNDSAYYTEIHFENGSIICNGNFNVTNNYAEIYMNNPHDYLYVKGNINIQNNRYYYSYTNGVLEAAGNVTIKNFITSDYFKVILSGSARQDITISDTASYIEYLENNNTSEEGINFVYARQINVFETNDDAKVSIYGEEVENGFTLFEDTTIDGDYSIGFGVLDLNGYTLTINGNFVQKGGDVVIGNGKLIVKGDYSIENETLDYRNQPVKALSSGRLIMNDENGSVLIYGNFTSHSVVETDGLLTAGVFELKGDFNQLENYGNFKASESHTVLLSGDKKQIVKFASPSSSKSHFNNFEISNTSDEGVEFGVDSTGPMAIGKVKDNGIKVTGSLVINGDTSFEDNRYCSDIYINESTTLSNEFEVEGNFKSGNYLYLKGKLTVDGDFIVSRYDTYVYSSDTYVKGDLIVGGGNSYAYMYIYGGTFTVEGDAQIKRYSYGYSYLYQNNNNSVESSFIVKGNMSVDTSCVFQGNFGTFSIGGDIKGDGTVQFSGTHKTIFNGTILQRVEINKNSYFSKIEINNSSQEGVSFQDFYGIGELVRNGNNFSYDGMNGYLGWTLNEDTEIDGDVRLIGDTLDLNGYTLKIKGNLIQSAGVVNVNGGKLEIEGDYRIQKEDIVNENTQYSASVGKLVMTNEQDYVLVGGSFYDQTSENSNGLLTAGLLEIKGDFYQISNSTSYTFTATENHTVKFSGDKKQTVKFSNYSNWYSYFNNLEIENASEDGIVFDSTNSVPGARGHIKDNGHKINGQLLICESTTFENNHYSSDILVSDSYFSLSSDIETDGDFKFSSYNISLNNKLTVGGNLSIQARYIYINSDINVKGDLLIGGEYGNYCYTYLYEGSLTVEGNLQISRYYSSRTTILYQSYNNNLTPIMVKGNMTIDLGCACYGYDGTLSLGGNLTGSGNLYGNDSHIIKLIGTEAQRIDISNNSYFGIIEVENKNEAGVTCAYLYKINNLVRNGNIFKYDGITGTYGWTLSEDTVWDEDLILLADTLDLNGYTLEIKGNLIQNSGIVYINGGKLIVDGDYRIQKAETVDGSTQYSAGNGVLKMTNEKDYVLVKGKLVVQSILDSSNNLNAGTLELKGDFNQISGSNSNFVATDSHTTVFSGDGTQTVKFDNTGNRSYFNNIEIKNVSVEGVVLDTTSSYPMARGLVKDNGNKVTGALAISGTTLFENNHYCSDIALTAGFTINNEIETDGDFIIDNENYPSLRGKLTVGGDLYFRGYDLYIYSDVYVKGNMYVNGFLNSYNSNYGYLYLYTGSLTVDGDVEVKTRTEDGYLRIYHEGYYEEEMPFTIKGDFYLGKDCYFSGYRGTLFFSGNVEVEGYFQFGDNHKTVFNGNDLQKIELSPNSFFANLEICNYSKAGVEFNRMIKYDSFIRNGCRVSFGENSYEMGWKLTENEVYDSNLFLWDDTLDLNGYTLTVNGDFYAMGGNVILNGGKLIVNRDLRVQTIDSEGEDGTVYGYGSAHFTMDNPNDYILVNGGFYYSPKSSYDSNSDVFSDGTIEIKGDCYLTGNSRFLATENNTVKFTGNVKQTYYSYNMAEFNTFINQNPEELNIDTSLRVKGSLIDETESISGSATFYVPNPSIIKNGVCSGSLYLENGCTLQEDLSVGGRLSINGEMHANGKNINANEINLYSVLYVEESQIKVANNIEVSYSGKLVMINAADYVLANGNFNFYSNYNHSDFLTAGTLEVRGDFTQSSYENFIASGTHTTILSPKMSTAGREYVQIIKFNAYAGTTRFNKVVLKKSDSGYQFSPALSEISNEVVYDIEDAEAPTAVEFIVAGEITEKKVTISFGGAEDNNGIVGYEIYRDGKRIGATSNTTYVDNTVDSGKEYTYTVFAFDDERNKASSSPALTVKTLDDVELPSIPQNLGIKTRTGSSLTLEWSPSSDNVKVVGYNIYADGVLVAEKVFDTYYKAKNLDKTHVYKYSVEAVDKSGNLSGRCDEIEAEVKMPTIVSVTPEDNSRIGNDSVILNVYYENVGNSTGNKVAIKIKDDEDGWNSLATKLTQKSASYGRLYSTYTWDISEYKGEESVTLKYILTDADGNEDSKEVNYVIDREGPEAPTNFKVEANNGNVNISFSPSASADCSRYEIYRVNYGGKELIANLSGRDNTFFIDKEVAVGGTYEYYVLAFDKFNNQSGVSNRVSVTIEEDHVAPEVMNITPRANRVNGELKLEVTASDNKSVSKIGIQYKAEEETEWIDVEEKDASNGVSIFKFDTTTLSDGAYFFNAYAIDGSGNRSTELYTRRYTVDNTGVEKIVVTEVTPGASYVRIEWEDVTDDNFGYFAVEQLKEGEFVRIAEERETLGLYVKDLDPETEYTFRVVGYDDLGNRGIESDEIVVTTLVDTTGPQITAVYPQSSNYNGILKLEMDANDDNELDYAVFSYSLDGNEYTEIDKVKAKAGSKEEHFVKNFNLSEIREGQIFVKFEAYDKAGNKNLLTQDDEDLIVEYNVDRTAPSKVSNLRFNSNEGCVELVWDELPEEETDVKGFRVWKADANNGIFSVLEDETQSINFFDYSVKVGSMYIYKVAAIDIAGNVGETSNEVVVTVIKDSEKPQILGISPHTNSKICANQTFSVSSLDNAAIASVRLEYTQYGDLNYWREIGKATESENYCISKITWDTEKVDEGEYYVRAIATDVYGNESEACMFTYVLDKTAPVVTDINAETGHFEITVNVTLEDKDDFSKMEILRREPGGEYITVGKSESLSFTDTGLSANTNYFYKVKVYDEAGNITFSSEVQGYADDVDVVAPVAVLPENIVGLVDMEVGLDGLASYDNVRITEYKWDMGNGDTVEGATATYTYHEPGEYTIKLTVRDKAGNSSSATTTAFIYGPETDEEGNIITRGKAHIQIVDEKGKGIPYALVYLQNSETSGMPLMADGNGYVDIVQRIGIARVAAYKSNYLPAQKDILITAGEVKKDTIVLREDELIVGSLSVHRMSLAEMVYTGVSFDSAGNNHTYRFEYTLVYKQKAYTEVIIVCDGKGKLECGPWEAPDWGPGGFEVTVIEEQPILIYITRQEEIKWLKNMYQVDLTVVNAADFQFYIDDAQATLSFPSGVSLADYTGPQTQGLASYSNMMSLSDSSDSSASAVPASAMTTSVSYPIYAHTHIASIGRIYGQEQKKVSWILRGDKSGEYGISANFKGVLMPFEAPVTAHFETGVTVTTGEGLHITVMPESTVDAGGENYIQYAVTNRSGYPIYNVKTTIPGFQAPPQIVSVYDKGTKQYSQSVNGNITEGQGEMSDLTVSTGGSQNVNGPVSIDVLMPGETYYGTYIVSMPAAVDPDPSGQTMYYWEFVEGFVRCLEGADLGVTVSISPIPGHYHRTFYGAPDPIVAFFGDPVDVTTGYYKDEVEALNIIGGQTVGYDLSYSSGSIEKAGENGYGWENPYEIYLEERGGKIALHTSPNGEALFVKSDKTLYGTFVDGAFVLDDTEDYSIGEYEGVSSGFKDYRIVKNQDSTFTLYYPGGAIRRFNSEGKLTQMETPEKQTISLSYDESNTIIKEDISGKTITVVHNENGLATELHDNAGRVTYLVYDDNSNLIAIVRPDGTQLTYTYDEKHRIIAASNNNGVFVTNSYDDKDRVVYQEDALGNPLTLSYEDHSNGGMKVTSIDAKGNARSVDVGASGLIFSETTAKGATTSYKYDKYGNLLEEIDPYNHVVYKSYDENGNITKVTDKGYSETIFSYDSNGNVVGITGNDEVGTSASYTYDGNNHMTSYTDPMGMTTTYAYNSNGQQISATRENLGSIQYGFTNGLLTSVTDPMGKTSYIEYDAYGNPVKTIDANGNATKYTFDLVGNKLSETDALGNTTYYTYDCNGNCTSVKDALGNVTKYDYDAMSHLIKETYADGSVITYVYDSVGNCISKTMPGGVVETYEYDETNHVVKASSTDGSSATFKYDNLGRKTSETDNLGRTNSFEYYPNGSVYKTTFGDGSSVLNTYNKRWKCTTKTYSDGSSEYTTYDKNGNVTSVTDSLGNTVKYEYDLYGRLIKEIDAMGYVTKYEYDSNDNCITKIDAEGRTAHMVYDAVGQLIEIYFIDSKGEKYSVKYEYDSLGRLISTTDEAGYTTRITYDAVGNVKSTIDANGNETDITTYDSVGRAISVKETDGTVTNYSYDARGNILTAIQNLSGVSKSTKYTYDSKGRVVSVKENDSLTTKVSYDSYGNVASVTDANGGVTKYQYDNLARLTAVISSLGNKETYTYNAQSLVSEYKNARGQKTSYTYDYLGRVTSMTDELGKVNYTYDANGNLTKVEDSKGIIKRTFDKLNRVTSYTDYNGDTIKYAYDELGNLMAITYPGGEVVRYEYYKNGWLKKVVDNNGKTTTYTYNALGQVATCTRPNNTKEIRTYNSKTGQLLIQREIKTDSNGAFLEEISNYVYNYNASGNISSVEGFDNNSEGLTSASFKYDSENRLIEYNGKEVRYDADGNMVYGPVNGVMTDLSYDCRNRLIYAGGVRYEYDAENTRIAEETNDYRAVFVTDMVSSELSRVLVKKTYNKTNGVVSNNITDRLYVYGYGLVSETEGASTLYHHYNNIGSTMKLSDGSGNVIAEYSYGPYGELLEGNTKLSDYLYNGQYGVSTDENGLYYMRQRYYNSEIKRFINQDILTGNVGDSQSMNRYAYVEGNPINLMDPFGLSPIKILSFVAHTVLGIVGCIPGIPGIIANVIDAAIYLVEGDYLNAALSGLCALSMGVATFATKTTCLGMKISKTAMVVYQATNLTRDVIDLVDNMSNLADQVNNIATKLATGEKITAGDLFNLGAATVGTVFATVSMVGSAGDFVDSISDLANVKGCFVEETEVETISGKKDIEDIEEGDYVLAENPETGEQDYKRVLSTYIYEKIILVHVFVGDEEIITTEEHPFYVEGEGFVPANELKEGDILRTSNDEEINVDRIEIEYLTEPVKVYNLRVKDFHTYFVSDDSILVHNDCLADAVKKNEEPGKTSESDKYKYDKTGEYEDVGGHHIFAKSAFKGDANYDADKAFCISQEFMTSNNLDHSAMTTAQRQLYKELYESGRPNTLAEQTRIAREALRRGGASQDMIDNLMDDAIKNLDSLGVTAPTRIPWYSK